MKYSNYCSYSANKYLPGVPNEAQVKEQGFSLDEMNTPSYKKLRSLRFT